MNKLLIDLKYLSFNTWELLAVISIIIALLIIIYLINRFNSQIKKQNKINIPIAGFYIITFWSAISAIFFIVIPDFTDLIIFSNKVLIIKPYSILLVGFIIFANFIIISVLNNAFKKSKSKTQKLLKLILWFFVVVFILKTILIDFSKISDFELFKIKDTSLIVFDIFFFLIILIVTWILLITINSFFRKQVKKNKLDSATSTIFFKIIKYFLWIIAILIALQTAGFELSIILAGSAALLVGLGMGIQHVFGDIASGIIILIERNIKIDDVVEVNGIVGKIVDTGLRTTTIITRDNIRMIVPNSKFTNENVINWSHSEKNTRFHVNIGVAYGSNVQLVIEILTKVANSHKDIVQEPESFVRFENFGNSSLDFQLFFFTSQTFMVENIKSDLRIIIDAEFRKNNITIPFPQTDVHFYKE